MRAFSFYDSISYNEQLLFVTKDFAILFCFISLSLTSLLPPDHAKIWVACAVVRILGIYRLLFTGTDWFPATNSEKNVFSIVLYFPLFMAIEICIMYLSSYRGRISLELLVLTKKLRRIENKCSTALYGFYTKYIILIEEIFVDYISYHENIFVFT